MQWRLFDPNPNPNQVGQVKAVASLLEAGARVTIREFRLSPLTTHAIRHAVKGGWQGPSQERAVVKGVGRDLAKSKQLLRGSAGT